MRNSQRPQPAFAFPFDPARADLLLLPRFPACANVSTFDVQDANEGEEPSRSGKVGFDLTLKPLQQQLRGIVVNPAPGHVDRFNLSRGRLSDRLIITVANREVFTDRSAKAREANQKRLKWIFLRIGNVESKPTIADSQLQSIRAFGPAPGTADRLESVFLDQVVDRDPSLLLDIRIAPQDRLFVESDMGDAVRAR